MNSDIKAVPTNIITGFLGVGKTSAILHLLNSKPDSERWAVLVNEFGEIGVDGSLFESLHEKQQGVFVREVPGGCMCCTAGLPMQVALNQLLSQARPDRLLIEPTGLGHPKEVLEVLSDEHYQDVLSLQKTLTLVDARNLSDERYRSNDTFNQQIAIADIVVGNKLDLYQGSEQETLKAYVQKIGQAHTQIVFCEQGKIDFSLLQGETLTNEIRTAHHHHHHHKKETPLACELPIPEIGFIKAVNEGEGFKSVGWRFSPSKTFDNNKLSTFLAGLNAERMKAVMITDEGIMGYNLTADSLTEIELDECFESRIEIIDKHIQDKLESQLIDCLLA